MRDLWQRVSTAPVDPGRPAVVDDEGVHTAGDLVQLAIELSDRLSPSGVPVTVLVRADSSWRLAVAALAVGRLGGTLALISKHATAEDYAVIREDVAMDLVVAPEDALRSWGALDATGSRTLKECLEGWSLLSTDATGSSRDVARWRGGSLIGMTSGSTGRAKAVIQTEAALQYAVACTLEANRIGPGDPVAGFVPLSSAAAFCFGLYLTLWNHSLAVLSDSWRPADVLGRINRHGAVWTMCVPTMLLQLGAAAAGAGSSLRSVTVGGGPMREEALAEAEASLGATVMRVFGMSEALGHTTPALDDPQHLRLSVDGRPFAGTQLRAVDESGTPLGADEVGRAQVRGPSVFVGYAIRGAATPREVTADGFFPTGDLIAVGADGSVRVAGREKDVIIRGGRNIDVVEVEHAILRHPNVDEVCVVPVPDDLFGERAAALLVSTTRAPSLGELQNFLAEEGVAKGKWPEFVFELPELPVTHVGKLSRAEARRQALAMHRDEMQSETSSEMQEIP